MRMTRPYPNICEDFRELLEDRSGSGEAGSASTWLLEGFHTVSQLSYEWENYERALSICTEVRIKINEIKIGPLSVKLHWQA